MFENIPGCLLLEGELSWLSSVVVSLLFAMLSPFAEDSACSDPKEIVARDEGFEISVESLSSEERTGR